MDWSGAFLVCAGVLMLLLAGWLLVLNPRSRLHRAFAIFLILRSVVNIVPGVLGLSVEERSLGTQLLGICWMALPAAGAYLIVALLAYVRGRRPAAAWAWICLVVGIAGVTAFLLEPRLLVSEGEAGAADAVRAPLAWWATGRFLVYAVAGWVFANHFAGQASRPEGRSSYLASLGIMLNAAHLSAAPFTNLLMEDIGAWDPFTWANTAVLLATFVVVVATLVRLAGVARSVPAARRSVAVYAGLTLLAMASRIPVDVAFRTGAEPSDSVLAYTVVVDGIWTLFMPILVAHAILRHGIFGTEKRVTLTLQRGTVAAMLLAAFFVATEMANNFFQVRGGWIFGSVAAGIMLFAAAPLQRAAERLTQLPQGRPTAARTATAGLDGRDLYRDHLRVVWADGNISTKERALLRVLRDRLGLTPADAERLEDEVLQG